MPGPLRVTARLEIPVSELVWKFSRSSGPGGQSVNTSDSRVELSFDIERSAALSTALSSTQRQRALGQLKGRLAQGVLTVVASEHRSQWKNRIEAEHRMTMLLAQALAPPPPPRRPTKPSLSSKRARVEAKRHRGEIKKNRRSGSDPE